MTMTALVALAVIAAVAVAIAALIVAEPLYRAPLCAPLLPGDWVGPVFSGLAAVAAGVAGVVVSAASDHTDAVRWLGASLGGALVVVGVVLELAYLGAVYGAQIRRSTEGD
jgi:hypothetical protein